MNESEVGMPKPGGIVGNLQTIAELHLCDIDAARCLEAQKVLGQTATVRIGDIRYLPYPDEDFDLVIDASTLDHVTEQQMPGVLDEYRRVLNGGGYVALLVWGTDADEPYVHIASGSANPHYTCYFRYSVLDPAIEDRFEVIERQRFYDDPNGFMTYYLLRKKGE